MKKVLSVSALALVLTLMLGSSAIAGTSASFTITEAHIYKVIPGSAEWKTYQEPEQKLAACYVDPAELAKMTTPALVETVLTYPLLGDMYAFDSLENGIKAVASRFAGIDELCLREDAPEVLRAYILKDAFVTAISRHCADALLQYWQKTRGSSAPSCAEVSES